MQRYDDNAQIPNNQTKSFWSCCDTAIPLRQIRNKAPDPCRKAKKMGLR